MVEKSTRIASRKRPKMDPLSVYEFTDDDLSVEVTSDSVDSKLNSTSKSAPINSSGRRTRSQMTPDGAIVGTESNAMKSPRTKGEFSGKRKDVNAAGKNKGKFVQGDEVVTSKKRKVYDGLYEEEHPSSSNLKVLFQPFTLGIVVFNVYRTMYTSIIYCI